MRSCTSHSLVTPDHRHAPPAGSASAQVRDSLNNGHEQQCRARGWSLDGRVAIVTGAAGGLGKAIVIELSERGADVDGVDIFGEGMRRHQGSTDRRRRPVLHADLSSPSGNRDMVAHVLATAGRLDILALNAGCQFGAPLDHFLDPEWERLRAVMLNGPFFALKAAWPALARSPGGRVVVTASTASFRGAARKAAYVAAKHGALGLVRVAAPEGSALPDCQCRCTGMDVARCVVR